MLDIHPTWISDRPFWLLWLKTSKKPETPKTAAVVVHVTCK